MEGPELGGEQQFCLRWNNFQANITSQFEALRDDEDFVDVTLACEGHRLEAHKVVLSACSPYFKELFKSNPCPHPIIFMRDCELIHITALLEFMYAGEVNIAQAQLTSFLRTAEALQIRGLTDSSDKQKDSKTTSSKAQSSQLRNLLCGRLRQESSPAKDSSQNVESNNTFQKTAKHLNQNRKAFRHDNDNSHMLTSHNGVSEKTQYPAGVSGSNNNCEMKDDALRLKDNLLNSQDDEKYMYNISENNPLLLNENEIPNSGKINPFAVGNVGYGGIHSDFSHEMIEPKIEVPDYTSEDESRQDRAFNPELLFGSDSSPQLPNPFLSLQGDIGAGTSQDIKTEVEAAGRTASSGRVSCPECGRRYSNLSNLRQHVRLIHRSQPVACPLCSRSFKTQLYLRRHTLSQHVKQNVPPDTLLVKINKGLPAPVPSVNSVPVRPVDSVDSSKTELNALNGYDSSGDCDASLESADVFKMEEDAISIIDDGSHM